MSTADLYIRVSTDEQAVKGFSQRSQEDRLYKYCTLHKIEIHRTLFEDYSAKSFNRPVWSKVMIEWNRFKEKRPDFVLFTQWDRFSRNVGDAYYMISKLKQLGIEPRAIEQPVNLTIPENKMMLALYLASSEVENDRRAINIKLGIRKARQEGKWPGRAPKGYLNVTSPTGQKYIIPHEPEAGAIRQIFSMVAEAKYSISFIHHYAVSNGLKCSRGYFLKLIHNPIYCGKIVVPAFGNEKEYLVKGTHEKIITEQLFNQVQAIVSHKKKAVFSNGCHNELLPLRGFLICPACGRTLTGSASQGHLKKYFYYHCRKECHFRLRADNLNNLFLDALGQLTPLSIFIDAFNFVLQETYFELYEKKVMGQAHTIRNMEQLIDRIVRARESLYNGSIDSDDFSAIKVDCEKRINTLGVQLQNLTALQLNKRERLNRLSNNLLDISTLYKNGDLAVKRQIINLAFEDKVIFRQPIEQMFGPAFYAIFNITSFPLNERREVRGSFQIEDESIINIEGYLNSILTPEMMNQYDPFMIKSIVKCLQKLAIVSLEVRQ